MTASPQQSGQTPRMPVLFVGHGSPMNAITDNAFRRGFASLPSCLPRTPRAILSISAHWYVDGTYLSANRQPRTIHDFGGFPAELYEIQYPAPGSPELATQVCGLIDRGEEALREDWGLDHGTWGVLRAMRPEADLPVVQLSLDQHASPAAHLELGKRLAPLREDDVLIFASGNVTHNLRDAFSRMKSGNDDCPAWAARFDAKVASICEQHDEAALAALWPNSDDARMAHPSPDHFLPLLYALGASDEEDPVSYPIEGWDLGSLSMRSIAFG